MKRCLLLMLFLICFSYLIPGLSPAQESEESYEGKRITDVEFEGLVKTDSYSVKSIVQTKPRSSFSIKTIDEDIKALYKMELFKDIQVDVTEGEDGLIVTFILEELPTVHDVIIRGNKRVSNRAIKDRILLKSGSVYKEDMVESDVAEIVKLYEERGYPNTTVTYEVRESKEKDKKTGERIPGVDLIFIVEESKKLVITALNFSGVESVSVEKLKSKMKTKERGYLLSRGFFQEAEFEADKKEILRYYGSQGYIDAEIVKVDREMSRNEERNRDEMVLTIYVKEGKQYRYGGVEFSGNKIFTDEELRSLVKLKTDAVFNQTEWEFSVQSIRNLLASNGYIYHVLTVDENRDTEDAVVSFDIMLTENNKAHVEMIFITGNKKTKNFVIAREIQIREGEIFNSDLIQKSIEKLYNLQYFSSVNVDVKPGSELGLVDLIFDVEEQRTGLFSFGLSYSTAGYGLSLFEEVSANNFLGRGLRLYEKVEIGYYRQGIELGIDEPWLFHKPTSAGLTLSYFKTRYGEATGDLVYTYNDGITDPLGNEVPDGVVVIDNGDGTYTYDYADAKSMEYTNQTYKMAIRLGRRFAAVYGVSSELGFSVFRNYSHSTDIPFEESLRDQFEDGYPWYWKNYLSVTGYRDTRDSFLFARRGSYLAQTISFFGGPLGGYSDFVRLNTDMNFNVHTFWKFVLSTRLNFGFIYPWLGLPLVIDDADYIRIDCWNEGRGWQRPSQFGSLYAMRGRAELNFTLEHRFPIQERFIWGLTFFDLSGLYDTPQDFAINFKDFYYSVGLGVSLVIPGFPIRLYLTRRFKYNEADEQLQLVNSQQFLQDWDFVFAVGGFF
jgi:outer membrane protein insertion porin family